MPLLYFIAALVFISAVFWFANTYSPLEGNIRAVVNVVLALIIVGMGLWLINNYIPMAGSIKAILNIVVVLATCVGVLQALGLWSQTVGLWRGFREKSHHLTEAHDTTGDVPPARTNPS